MCHITSKKGQILAISVVDLTHDAVRYLGSCIPFLPYVSFDFSVRRKATPRSASFREEARSASSFGHGYRPKYGDRRACQCPGTKRINFGDSRARNARREGVRRVRAATRRARRVSPARSALPLSSRLSPVTVALGTDG